MVFATLYTTLHTDKSDSLYNYSEPFDVSGYMGTLKTLVNRALGSEPFVSLSLSSNKKPLVLLYHGVSKERNREGIYNYRGKHIPQEAFRRQILFLKKHFEIVPLSVIEKHTASPSPTQKPLCAITFDDGYKNNYEVAFPVLKELAVPATIFVTSSFIEGTFLWPDRLEYALGNTTKESLRLLIHGKEVVYSTKTKEDRISTDEKLRLHLKRINDIERKDLLFSIEQETGSTLTKENSPKDYLPLTKDDIKELHQNNIRIGAHTNTHPILSKLPREKQEEEIAASITYLKEIVGECREFAYPNGQLGDFNSDTEVVLRKLGFTYAWTTERRRIQKEEKNLLALPRVTVDNGHLNNRFEALVSGTLEKAKQILES